MFENKYDSTTNTKETEYVPVPETNEKKKGGFKKVIKGIGVLCLMGAISFGSVKGYQYYNNSKEENLSVSRKLPRLKNLFQLTHKAVTMKLKAFFSFQRAKVL